MRTSLRNVLPVIAKLFAARSVSRRTARRHGRQFRSRPFLESLEPRRLLAADLSVTKLGPAGDVAAGSTVTYTIVVSNPGPDTATATLTDTIPSAITSAMIASTASGGATGNTSGTVAGGGTLSNVLTLPAGSSVTYTATGTVSPAATGTLSNTAQISSADDTTPGNNAQTVTNTLTAPAADLSIFKTSGTTTTAPGSTQTYVVVVTNSGPSLVNGATVTDDLPAGATFTAAATGGATGFQASGSGDINNTVNLPVGSTIRYVVTAPVSSGATGTITNQASVAAPLGVTEINAGNNAATDVDTVAAAASQADLAISKTNATSTIAPGGQVTYVIVVTNSGPSAVTGATVADVFPSSIINPSFTVATTGGATGAVGGIGAINQTVSLPVGSSIIYTVTGTASTTAIGAIANSATITAPPGVADTNPANNIAVDSDVVSASTGTADVTMTKSDNDVSVSPGDQVTYTIVVANAGQTPVTGAVVSDVVPASLTGVTFSSTAIGGATGNTSGSGSINNIVNLPVGSSVTYTVTGTVSAAPPSAIVNTATVTLPPGVADLTPGNNVVTDIDNVVLTADLSVTKTDNVSSVDAGGSLTYTIVVSNSGPSAVTGATVTDTFSPSLTGVNFTAVGTGGASGFSSGAGSINQTVNLPSGATITYTVTAAVSPGATGTLVNTVNVNVPGGVTDTNPGNNAATDTDTITTAEVPTDLDVDKTANQATVAAGEALTYTIIVTNTGTTAAQNVVLTDAIPAGTTFVSATQSSGAPFTLTTPAAGGTGAVTASGATLPAGSSATFTVTVLVDDSLLGATIENSVTVTSSTAETNQGNNTTTVSTDVEDEVVPPLECIVETFNVPGDPGTAELTEDADGLGTALIITGTARKESIVVIPFRGDQIRVLINGRNKGTFDRSDVDHIVVFAGAGNDKVVINASLTQAATLLGEAGNDHLFGARGDDGLDGGSGKDFLYGGRGNDTLCGGSGNDFLFGQQDNDLVGGDSGNDRVFGESGNDVLVGSDGNDFVYGGSGQDQLFGQAGSDKMFGGSGDDALAGGSGNDRLFGGSGRDLLIGGEGSDDLFGESGDDILIGGSTAFDEDPTSLEAILDDLTANRSFSNRVDDLSFGTGESGIALDDSSLEDDDRADTLFGGAGQDWFLVGPRDRVRDRRSNDRVN